MALEVVDRELSVALGTGNLEGVVVQLHLDL
jgi:hypothetical protein